jgi:hypothetical protein
VKRGCIIVILLLLGVVLAGAVGGYLFVRAQLGLDEAPERSYNALVNDSTRFVAAAEPRQLAYLIERFVVPEIERWQGPEFIKARLKGYATGAIPNQVAVLGGPVPGLDELVVTYFINERYFGPAISAFTQRPEEFQQQVQTEYTGPPFFLPERGTLVAELSYPLLRGVEPLCQQYWPANVPPAPMEGEGGHLFEALVSNRQGEMLQILGAVARQQNPGIGALFSDAQQERASVHLLRLFSDARFTMDLEENHALQMQLATSRMEGSPSPLQTTFTAHMPPSVMEAVEEQFQAGQFAPQTLLEHALQQMDQFAYEIYFDNQREEFMALMANLGVFEIPGLAEQEQQLRTVIRLMTESTITGFLMDNGDLTGEWEVFSKSEDKAAVFVALGFLPIDQALIPALEDMFARMQMTFEVEPARMEDEAAYARRFTIRGFQPGLLALVQGRTSVQNILSSKNAVSLAH